MVIWQIGAEGGTHNIVEILDGTHKYAVTSMQYEEDTGCVISSGEDGKIRRWTFEEV